MDGDQGITTDQPLVPMLSALRLGRAAESKLIRLAKEALDRGRSSYRDSGHLKIRKEATMAHAGDFSFRVAKDTIYEFSNISLNTCKRFVRITAARGFDDLLSTEPLLSVTPEGDEDDSKDAATIGRFASYKIAQANAKATLREAVLAACIRGEAVVKTIWKTRKQRYKTIARALLDDEGKPVKASDGDYVTTKDAWITRSDGTKILARDPNIILQGPPRWGGESIITCHRRLYDGIETKVIDYRDFICGTTEESVDSAGFKAHVFDMPFDQVAGMFAAMKDDPPVAAVLHKLRTTATTNAGAESAKPDERRGEQERGETAMPTVKLAECWMTVVLEDDGVADDIVVLFDIENEIPLFYNYAAEAVPPGFLNPFKVVRIEPVPGRWTGMGFYELFADRQKFIDLMLNRVNFQASSAGRIDASNPNASEETKAGEPIEFGRRKTYTLRDGFTLKDLFDSKTIDECSEASMNLMQMTLQATQLEAGMITAGDQSFSNLPSAGLATGIKSLDRVANTLLKNTFYDLILGIEEVLALLVACALRYHDPREAEQLMGAENAAILQKYRDTSLLPYKVKLLVSAAKDEDLLKANQQAIDTVISWESLQPEQKLRLSPVYTKILKALGVEDIDKILGLDELAALAKQAALMPPTQGNPPQEINGAGAPQPQTQDPNGQQQPGGSGTPQNSPEGDAGKPAATEG